MSSGTQTVKDYQKIDEKQKIVYNRLISKGYTPQAAIGILGNLVRESGLDTGIEGDKGYKGGSSFGIAQWREGRLTRLKNMYGSNWNKLENQVDFLDWELNNTHKGAGNKLKGITDVHSAGQIFSDDYERPQKKYHQDTDRRNAVSSVAKNFMGYVPQDNYPTTQSEQTATPYTTDFEVTKLDAGVNLKGQEKQQAKEELTAINNEKQLIEDIANNRLEIPQEKQDHQNYQQPQIQEPTLSEHYAQISQFVDTPIAQQGGRVINVNGKPMNTDSQEYRELYKNGKIQNSKVNGEDIPYFGGELNEVIVKQTPREKGFWEQSRDQYLEENKDVGLLGAIGSVATYPMRVPQQAMMYATTGKVQKPSEGIGVENKYGAMATDMILDPTNLVGAGILTKEKALSALARSTEKGILSKTYKINPFAFKPNPEAYYRTLGEDGLKDAIKNNVLRANPKGAVGETMFLDGKAVSFNKPSDVAYFAKGNVSPHYPGADHIAEVNKRLYSRGEINPVTGNSIRSGHGAYRNIDELGRTINIPLKEASLYKKDWLQGYKQIELPEQLVQQSNQVVKNSLPNPIKIADKIIPRPLAPGHFLGLDDSWNNYSPLNLIPGYGEKLVDKSSTYPNFVGFRKFGNSIDDVVESQSLRPNGSGMGSEQIQMEGNWAESGKVNENYSGVFEATMNPQIKGSNIKLERWNKRNGIVGTTKDGDVAIPLTDEGLSFNRRLPFSNRYVPIDKQKLINKEFQLATQLPHLQSLTEKYGIYSGLGAGAAYLGAPELHEANKKYIVNPIIEQYKRNEDFIDANIIDKKEELPQKKDGGYVVTRSNDRKGKTHKVTSSDGTVKYFGDSNLGQHPKDPKRKAAFYARHKENLKNNPFFRAFARKTWQEGGEIDYEDTFQQGGLQNYFNVIEDQQGQRKFPNQVTKINGDTMATDGYGNIPLYVVPNVGKPRIIFPNTGEHTFKGAKYFTEYPIKK